MQSVEFSSCYERLIWPDDVQVYEDGHISIEVNTVSDTINLDTNLDDLEALVKRAREWQAARTEYVRSLS